MAFMAKNRKLSHCKVVEVIAETTAPLLPMGELLSRIPPQRADTLSIEVFGLTEKFLAFIYVLFVCLSFD